MFLNSISSPIESPLLLSELSASPAWSTQASSAQSLTPLAESSSCCSCSRSFPTLSWWILVACYSPCVDLPLPILHRWLVSTSCVLAISINCAISGSRRGLSKLYSYLLPHNIPLNTFKPRVPLGVHRKATGCKNVPKSHEMLVSVLCPLFLSWTFICAKYSPNTSTIAAWPTHMDPHGEHAPRLPQCPWTTFLWSFLLQSNMAIAVCSQDKDTNVEPQLGHL